MFLDKIPAKDWTNFITRHFRKRGRTLDDSGLETLLTSADLIPYDMRRIAHELWDYAELEDKRQLDVSDVNSVIDTPVTSQSTYYELLLWEQLLTAIGILGLGSVRSCGPGAALQAIAYRGASEIYSQGVREQFRLGPASSVQKALQSLDSRDILDRCKGSYFFLDRCFLAGLERRVHRRSCAMFASSPKRNQGKASSGLGVVPTRLNKKDLSERDICSKFTGPAVKRAGWHGMMQIREEVNFTKGRIIVPGEARYPWQSRAGRLHP